MPDLFSQDLHQISDQEAEVLCQELRRSLLTSVSQTGGHLASNLGAVELTVAIHRVYDTAKDRLVFDVGHQCYCHKILTGRAERMTTLRKMGGLSGFPKPEESDHDAFIAGHASNSVSVAVGMALAGKMDGRDYRVYTIMGDGELAEGSVWEGVMSGGNYQLDNLCALVDRNRLQIDGSTETVMSSEPLEEKMKAFNFNVLTINGHDYDQIEAAIQAFHAENDKPTCIIMDTTKGKGVSFMTNSVDWHGKGPNDDEYKVAMEELNAAYAALEQEEK